MTLRSEAKAAVDEAKLETASLWITIVILSLNETPYFPDNPETEYGDTETTITGLETKFSWLEISSGKVQVKDRRFLIDPDDYATIKTTDQVSIGGIPHEVLAIHKVQQDVLYKLDLRAG